MIVISSRLLEDIDFNFRVGRPISEGHGGVHLLDPIDAIGELV